MAINERIVTPETGDAIIIAGVRYRIVEIELSPAHAWQRFKAVKWDMTGAPVEGDLLLEWDDASDAWRPRA